MNLKNEIFELMQSVGNLGYWVINNEKYPGMVYGSENHNKIFDFDFSMDGLFSLKLWRKTTKTYDPKIGLELKHKIMDLYLGRTDHLEIVYPIMVKGVKRWIKSNGFCKSRNEHGKAVEVIGTAIDITDLMMAKERLEYLAYQDEITGLPNREKLFLDYKENKIMGYNLVYMDLDGFKDINDKFGHEFGDKCLKSCGNRLKRYMEEVSESQFYRLYGDEFIGFYNILENQTIEENIEIGKSYFQEPHIVDGTEIKLSFSMGIIENYDESLSLEELLHKADTAMYLAKKTMKRLYIYKENDRDMFKNSRQYIIERDIMSNLDNDNIIPYYQPILNKNNSKIEAIEILVRLKVGNELISADEFIDIAIQRRKVEIIDKIILEKGIILMSKLLDEGVINKDISMSFNISEQTLIAPDFVDYLVELIEAHSVDYKNIILEFVEKSSIAILKNEELIRSIKKLGIRISLDDLSAGNSSINAIRFDLYDIIKFDKELLWRATENENIGEVYNFFINLMTKNKLDIVAEGIETELHNDFLKQKDVKYLQGYIFSKPISEENLIQIMSK